MTQDSEVISGMELSDLKIICIVGNPKCTTRIKLCNGSTFETIYQRGKELY